MVDDAEVVYVAYGSTSRIVKEAVGALRAEGLKIGLIRPKTLWPFPDKAFEKVGSQIKHVISVELSKSGQLRPVSLITRYGGMLLDPAEVIERTKKILEVK